MTVEEESAESRLSSAFSSIVRPREVARRATLLRGGDATAFPDEGAGRRHTRLGQRCRAPGEHFTRHHATRSRKTFPRCSSE